MGRLSCCWCANEDGVGRAGLPSIGRPAPPWKKACWLDIGLEEFIRCWYCKSISLVSSCCCCWAAKSDASIGCVEEPIPGLPWKPWCRADSDWVFEENRPPPGAAEGKGQAALAALSLWICWRRLISSFILLFALLVPVEYMPWFCDIFSSSCWCWCCCCYFCCCCLRDN